MIKINLATRKQAQDVAGKDGSSVSSALKKIDLAQINEILPLRKILVPIAVGFVVSFTLDTYKEDEMKKIEMAFTQVNDEKTRLQTDLEKFKVYESIKKQLDGDEQAIKSKLDVIRKLMASKGGALKVILGIANVLPSDAWIKDLQYEGTAITIKGACLEYAQLSDFMRGLNESTLFSDVQLKSSEKLKVNNSKNSETTFELTLNRR